MFYNFTNYKFKFLFYIFKENFAIKVVVSSYPGGSHTEIGSLHISGWSGQ
jgi:hypothetical protein